MFVVFFIILDDTFYYFRGNVYDKFSNCASFLPKIVKITNEIFFSAHAVLTLAKCIGPRAALASSHQQRNGSIRPRRTALRARTARSASDGRRSAASSDARIYWRPAAHAPPSRTRSHWLMGARLSPHRPTLGPFRNTRLFHSSAVRESPRRGRRVRRGVFSNRLISISASFPAFRLSPFSFALRFRRDRRLAATRILA